MQNKTFLKLDLTQTAPGFFCLTLNGHFDLHGRAVLEETFKTILQNSELSQVTVDMSAVCFISSVGIGFLQEIRDVLRERKITLFLKPGPTLEEAFHLLGLSKEFSLL